MSFYLTNLAIFAVIDIVLLTYQYWRRKQLAASETREHGERVHLLASSEETWRAATKLQLQYFSVYVFVVAADWLQGPHIYAIYKYEKHLPEKIVAALYAVGFVSGAVSASFAGALADRFGRRLACLVYCLAYTVTCLSMLSDNLVILFMGRVCGGLATTLLYSVFEAWLISEYHARDLFKSQLKLSTTFGYMTTMSTIVAIISGATGDALVAKLDGKRVWPFMAGAACAVLAGVMILIMWPENYGSSKQDKAQAHAEASTTEEGSTVGTLNGNHRSFRTILQDRRILGLGLTSTFFEGTMYLFVFFWSAALKSARDRSGLRDDLPFGVIFSCFMCSMMAGSVVFSLVSSTHTRVSAARILSAVVLLTSCSLSGAVVADNEMVLFWCFCLVEFCVGVYFPSISFLRSEVVEDGVRGRVYSVLRLPLNLFVVTAHALDQEGDAHRQQVFVICAALLMVSFVVVRRTFLT